MCDKAANTHSSTITYVPDQFKTQEMCDKSLNKSFLIFIYIPDQYKTQEIYDRIISEDPFYIRYVPDQYKTQQMCDEAVDDCLATLKFVPDWFVTSKMIKKLFTALYAGDNILYVNEDSSDAVFPCNGMGLPNIDLNNINFDDTNYDEDDPESVIHVRLFAWHIKFEKLKTLKKQLKEELMPIQ